MQCLADLLRPGSPILYGAPPGGAQKMAIVVGIEPTAEGHHHLHVDFVQSETKKEVLMCVIDCRHDIHRVFGSHVEWCFNHHSGRFSKGNRQHPALRDFDLVRRLPDFVHATFAHEYVWNCHDKYSETLRQEAEEEAEEEMRKDMEERDKKARKKQEGGRDARKRERELKAERVNKLKSMWGARFS